MLEKYVKEFKLEFFVGKRGAYLKEKKNHLINIRFFEKKNQ